MSGGSNHSRLKMTTYPNGRAVATVYLGGTDDTISRPTYLWDGTGTACGATIEQSSYLGWDAVVERYRAQSGTRLTYLMQTGESAGDAGDKYRGLNRFGPACRGYGISSGAHETLPPPPPCHDPVALRWPTDRLLLRRRNSPRIEPGTPLSDPTVVWEGTITDPGVSAPAA